MSVLSLMERAGQSIPDGLPNKRIQTIFNATDLNWTVEQQPVHSRYGEITDVVANYRSDTKQFLGFVHPKEYKVVSNIEAFNFVDQLPNFNLEKVGTFNGGKKVFVVGKSNEQICIDKQNDDMVNFYFTFLHGHDGKSSIRFIICPIRMFCMNQLNLMMRTAQFKYSIKHIGDVFWKLNQIQQAISNSRHYVSELQTTIDEMINTKPNITIQKLVQTVIVDKEDDTERQLAYKSSVRDAIIDLYNTKDDLQNYKNTSFGMLSAVSDYISHIQPRRNCGESTISNAFISSIEGSDLLETARNVLLAA